MPRTTGVALCENRLLVVHGMADPTDEDWQVYLDAVEVNSRQNTAGLLMFTLGGAPNSVQRQKEERLLPFGYRAPPTAVMTNSTATRAVVTALHWLFHNRKRAFALDDIEGARQQLGATPEQMARIMAEVHRLAGECR